MNNQWINKCLQIRLLNKSFSLDCKFFCWWGRKLISSKLAFSKPIHFFFHIKKTCYLIFLILKFKIKETMCYFSIPPLTSLIICSASKMTKKNWFDSSHFYSCFCFVIIFKYYRLYPMFKCKLDNPHCLCLGR